MKQRYSRQLEQQNLDLKTQLEYLTTEVGMFVRGDRTLIDLQKTLNHTKNFLTETSSTVLAEEPQAEPDTLEEAVYEWWRSYVGATFVIGYGDRYPKPDAITAGYDYLRATCRNFMEKFSVTKLLDV